MLPDLYRHSDIHAVYLLDRGSAYRKPVITAKNKFRVRRPERDGDGKLALRRAPLVLPERKELLERFG